MSLKQTSRAMIAPLNDIGAFGIEMHRLLASKEHAVMLSWQDFYAVCRTRPERSLVIATNYASTEGGILTGPLSIEGLRDLLSWVDRPTADLRFKRLLMDCGRPALYFVGHGLGTADSN